MKIRLPKFNAGDWLLLAAVLCTSLGIMMAIRTNRSMGAVIRDAQESAERRDEAFRIEAKSRQLRIIELITKDIVDRTADRFTGAQGKALDERISKLESHP